jgi:hypothetical protein
MGTSTNGIIAFGESGDYAEGWSENDPRFEEYFSLRRKRLSENPVPFQAENYCSGDRE